MDTQEAQTIVNNIKDTNDAQYKKAKAFLEKQQVKGKTKKELKQEEKARKEEATREWMTNRADVQNAVRRSQIANPSVGVVDRVTGNVTGLNENVLDPNALKARDLNVDGTIKDKDFTLGNSIEGDFIGAEEEKTGKSENKKGDKSASNGLDNQTQSFMDKNNAISYAQEDSENERQQKELEKRWDARLKNMEKMSQSMKNIDDHYVNNLPTFMFKRYADGEFGDPKRKDAKIRLAYFMLNGLQSKLKNASNLFMSAAGKAPAFADTTSDYEKFKDTNFANAMENRWNKYKQETQSAIDLAKQGGMSEEAITDSIATISSNNRLQSAFNQMNERQKVFTLQVMNEIGGKLGNMNDEQFANTIMAMAYSGDSLDYKEAAGMLIYRFVKDPEKRSSLLSELGFKSDGKKPSVVELGKDFVKK